MALYRWHTRTKICSLLTDFCFWQVVCFNHRAVIDSNTPFQINERKQNIYPSVNTYRIMCERKQHLFLPKQNNLFQLLFYCRSQNLYKKNLYAEAIRDASSRADNENVTPTSNKSRVTILMWSGEGSRKDQRVLGIHLRLSIK